MILPNSTVINERTVTCSSDDKEGESLSSKGSFKPSNFCLEKPDSDSLQIFGSTTRVYEGDRINLTCQGGPSYPGIAMTGELLCYQITITPAVKLEWTVGGEPRKTDEDLPVQSERRSLSSSNLDITVSS